jgi:FKBP-type peptidyl-prolyl cis-trans isomerase
VVAIRRVVETSRRNRSLQEGMIVKDFDSAQQVMEKLKHGPYPLKLDFVNLAAGGDAFNDLGGTIVTPKDALQLAEKTTTGDSSPSSSSNNSNNENHFSMTTIERPPKTQCAMESRRGDVLEINYEAVYVGRDGKKVTYDASIFRGTGLPYQLVLDSGDMIPGVDQGLYDMCPGETRELKIPPLLGYSSAGTQIFNIPPDYHRLEWKVELVSIDTTVRADNNVQSRQEREGRVL